MTSVFDETNLSRAIARVGLPAMLGQLTTLIYNMADTFFVSLTQEPAMIAAVTLCTPVLLIIMSIACVFGMGGSSVIARLLGEGRKEYAGKTVNFCTYAMALSGVFTAVLGLLQLAPLAELAGADAENLGYTQDYLRYVFLGAPFIMLSNGFVHLFRSAGLIRESTVGLVLGNAINIVLDYVFIIPQGWGGRRSRCRHLSGVCLLQCVLSRLHGQSKPAGRSSVFCIAPGILPGPRYGEQCGVHRDSGSPHYCFDERGQHCAQ